jgi:carbonic anhydrase
MPLSRRSMLGALFACPVCAMTARAEAPHWTYEEAPKWGELDKSFAACATGGQQSPIDLTHAIQADLPALKLDWKPQPFKINNNGHTIQADAAPGSSLLLDGKKFELKQFHFHTPSEHTVNGAGTVMEAHFVHAGPDGDLAVIGAFLKAGKSNPAFSAIMAQAPKQPGVQAAKSDIDPKAFLPGKSRAYYYEGSLTTPPCSEVVNWIVYADAIEVAQADIDAFKAIYAMNARPVQARNRRYILGSP